MCGLDFNRREDRGVEFGRGIRESVREVQGLGFGVPEEHGLRHSPRHFHHGACRRKVRGFGVRVGGLGRGV